MSDESTKTLSSEEVKRLSIKSSACLSSSLKALRAPFRSAGDHSVSFPWDSVIDDEGTLVAHVVPAHADVVVEALNLLWKTEAATDEERCPHCGDPPPMCCGDCINCNCGHE